MLIALNAFAQGGKDTAAKPLIERGYRQKAFADPLRDFLYAINPIVKAKIKVTPNPTFDPDRGMKGTFGVQPDSEFFYEPEVVRYADVIDSLGYEEVKRLYPEARDLLQRVGTEGGRKILGDNIWVETAFQDIEGNEDVVFTDCRFPNEADEVRKRGGKVIRIERPGLTAVNAHVSETALLDYRFDYIVNNDGTVEQLQERILTYVDSVA